MKNIFFIIIVLSLTLFGCSPTYRVSEFPSKENFFEHFNNFAKDKIVNIKLKNDSLLIGKNIGVINDTLYSYEQLIDKLYKKFPLSKIKEINYTDPNYKAATLLLENDVKYDADEIKIKSDSVEFSFLNTTTVKNVITPINMIKEVVYRRNWSGVPLGFLTGAVTGYITGAAGAIPVYSDRPNTYPVEKEINRTSAGFYGLLSGAVIGGVIGYFFGYTYTYQFNL
jgi:hypothetical protein